MLLARAGFDPERVLDMTEAQAESLIEIQLVSAGVRSRAPVPGIETRRFVSRRKKR